MRLDQQTLPEIKFIAFDFCGTLAELMPSTSELIINFVRSQYELELTTAVVEDALSRASLELPYSSLQIKSNELRANYYHDFNSRLLGNLGCTPPMPGALYEYFTAHKRHWKIKPGGRELLDELRGRGYGLVIASNFDENLEQLLSGLGVRDYFSHLFVSAVLGLEKPSVAFYERIVDVLGCSPNQILMIGDDFSLDISPTGSIGMFSVYLSPRSIQPSAPISEHCLYRISNLQQLLDFLI
jgi:FMN phosphatase YigB (HAD superfamily)